MESKTYPLNSPGELAQVSDRIQSKGGPAIDPTSPKGEWNHKGVDLAWVVAPDGLSITVDLVERAWYDPSDAAIWAQIDDLFTPN